MTYIAHRSEDGREQKLIDHLEGTAHLAMQFASVFGGQQDAKLAGLLHDIGKYSDHFQRRIRDPEHVAPHDHATAGAKECSSIPVKFAIMGHHSGIPDGGSRCDTADHSTFYGRMRKTVDDYTHWQSEIVPPQGATPDFLMCRDPYTNFRHSFYTRMLFSCLVDADFIDTETFMQGAQNRGCTITMDTLLTTLQNHFDSWRTETNELNNTRKRIRDDCEKSSQWDKGLYTLTVPTGGGKTLSSLSFALRHACKHQLKRIIYVIPYTSIIDQTAETFSRILGHEHVLEHHSSVFYDTQSLTPLQHKQMLATENWDAPVIVTTAVQFFESLFSNRSSRTRKLHNIAESVIIFDEAQTMPVAYLKPCVAAIAELITHYGASAVLCTATQPALEPFFLAHGLQTKEIISTPCALYRTLCRTTIAHCGLKSDEELVDLLTPLDQVLCIVNTRKFAKTIYSQLPPEGSYCLTTLLYPKHRKKLLQEIRMRLQKGLPCRVIATSLIEAGVDVDFPCVYRQEAGLDSILQAGGRCNREGKRMACESYVYVFESTRGTPASMRQKVDATKRILLAYKNPERPEAIEEYFTFYRSLLGNASLDSKGILDAFDHGIDGNMFPFATVSQQFQLIDSPTRSVYIPLEEGKTLTDDLRLGNITRQLYRNLGQFGVSIYPNHFDLLVQSGAVEVLENGDGILCDLTIYDCQTGLSMDVETGVGLFI